MGMFSAIGKEPDYLTCDKCGKGHFVMGDNHAARCTHCGAEISLDTLPESAYFHRGVLVVPPSGTPWTQWGKK